MPTIARRPLASSASGVQISLHGSPSSLSSRVTFVAYTIAGAIHATATMVRGSCACSTIVCPVTSCWPAPAVKPSIARRPLRISLVLKYLLLLLLDATTGFLSVRDIVFMKSLFPLSNECGGQTARTSYTLLWKQ